jgi:ferredoxin
MSHAKAPRSSRTPTEGAYGHPCELSFEPDRYVTTATLLALLGPVQDNAVAFSSAPKEEVFTPKLTVDRIGQFEVAQGKRLVLALEQDAGVDYLHACGGNARFTTCRIEFVEGEPDRMTVAERDVLNARGLSGIRLSCQIACDQDMIRFISRLAGSGRKDAGHPPAAKIQPPLSGSASKLSFGNECSCGGMQILRSRS